MFLAAIVRLERGHIDWIGGVEGALAGFVDHRLVRQWTERIDDGAPGSPP
jgi:hypothetical protein